MRREREGEKEEVKRERQFAVAFANLYREWGKLSYHIKLACNLNALGGTTNNQQNTKQNKIHNVKQNIHFVLKLC